VYGTAHILVVASNRLIVSSGCMLWLFLAKAARTLYAMTGGYGALVQIAWENEQ